MLFYLVTSWYLYWPSITWWYLFLMIFILVLCIVSRDMAIILTASQWYWYYLWLANSFIIVITGILTVLSIGVLSDTLYLFWYIILIVICFCRIHSVFGVTYCYSLIRWPTVFILFLTAIYFVPTSLLFIFINAINDINMKPVMCVLFSINMTEENIVNVWKCQCNQYRIINQYININIINLILSIQCESNERNK